LIIIEVDYFKRHDDRYGRSADDDCLKMVGRAIQSILKRPADLAIRYGRKEFIVLLPDADSSGADTVAGALRESIRALRIKHADHSQGSITASRYCHRHSIEPRSDSSGLDQSG